MSRPKPTVILSYTEPKTFKTEQVLEATAIFAVFYNGEPVNLRSIVNSFTNSGLKYRKVSFSNPGHAFNLRRKLNSMFKTDKFTVVKLTAGETVEDDEPAS